MENATAPAQAVSAMQIFGMVALLLLVLAGTYYATRLIGKMMGGQMPVGTLPGTGAGGPVKVLSRLTLGKGQYLVTIAYGGTEYLLGVCERNITVIATRALSDAELAGMDERQAKSGFSAKFQKACREYMHKKGDGEDSVE